MTYGTVQQVATELGRPFSSVSQTETDQWQQWLESVERSIEARFMRAGLDLSTQVTANNPPADLVADVEVAVVARKVRNPAGTTSKTVSVDDGSVTDRYHGGDTGGALLLTDSEWGKLLPLISSGAWSTRPGFEPDHGGRWDVWFPA